MSDISGWMIGIIAFCSALMIGQIAGRLVRGSFSRSDRPPEVAEFASAIGRVVMWCAVAIGSLVAVSALNPDSFSELPDKATNLLPRSILACAIAVIGYALSIAATAALAAAAVRTSGVRHRVLERMVRISILAITTTVALSMLDVDPLVLAVALGLTAGAPLLTAAVLTAQGSRDVAQNLAAGRALRSHLRVGRHLEFGDVHGTIIAVHQVVVELRSAEGNTVQVPLRLLLDQPFSVSPLTERSGHER